jgi:hypothetical protein
MVEAITAVLQNGPGWFEDIFDVQIFYDADLEAPVLPYTSKDLALPQDDDITVLHHDQALFSSGAIVRGFARIRAPTGRTIWHGGIGARLESNFLAMGDISTRELHSEEIDLVPAGYISGTVDIPFAFESTATTPLQEYYEGSLFSIRHSVQVTIARPWYTFAVTAGAPFAVQRIHDVQRPSASARRGTDEQGGVAVVGDAAAAASSASSSGPGMEEQLALYGPQQMFVDLSEDGRLELRIDKGWCVSRALVPSLQRSLSLHPGLCLSPRTLPRAFSVV